MQLPFVKMHGTGNDFLIVDAFDPRDRYLADLARSNATFLCDRKFGVGADGVIVVLPSQIAEAEFRMAIYNADGSESEMCGNGLRCFAKYVYEREYTASKRERILTGRGVLTADVLVEKGIVQSVQIDMGEPILAREQVPAAFEGDSASPVIDDGLIVDGRDYRVTCVSMGNPHCVVFLDEDIANIPITRIGPMFEHHPAFPKRTNTEFVNVGNRGEYRMRVWERGVGETLACGTGACAVCVAGVLTGRMDRHVIGHLSGGDLQLEWSDGGPVMMTGGAVHVFAAHIGLTANSADQHSVDAN